MNSEACLGAGFVWSLGVLLVHPRSLLRVRKGNAPKLCLEKSGIAVWMSVSPYRSRNFTEQGHCAAFRGGVHQFLPAIESRIFLTVCRAWYDLS